MPRLRIGVVYGGRSGEHEVSLMSARSIIGALDPEKYDVTAIGITKYGQWVRRPIPEPADALDFKVEPTATVTVKPDPTLWQGFDVIFPVLHGTYGEDGTIQGLLELAGIPYVGAGVTAAAVSMDKTIMRVLFAQAGISLAPWEVVTRHESDQHPEAVYDRIKSRLKLPVFVKPANLGSSVGVSKVKVAGDLGDALLAAFAYDHKVVVEQGVENAREIEASVLGNEEPEVAPVFGEIIPANEFYDYEAKYHSEQSKLIIPAQVTPEQAEILRSCAVRAYKAVDCAGMARVDFFLTSDGEVILNEINTIPGFTRISMYPKLWEASGLSYRQLVDRLIALALARHEQRQKLKTSL